MSDLVEQPTKAPTRKVRYGAINGTILGVCLAWTLGQFGVDMPAEVAVAFGSLIGQAVSYFTKESRA